MFFECARCLAEPLSLFPNFGASLWIATATRSPAVAEIADRTAYNALTNGYRNNIIVIIIIIIYVA